LSGSTEVEGKRRSRVYGKSEGLADVFCVFCVGNFVPFLAIIDGLKRADWTNLLRIPFSVANGPSLSNQTLFLSCPLLKFSFL